MNCRGCGASVAEEDAFCEECGLRQNHDDRVVRDLGGVAGISDVGRRHHRNEDAMALRHLDLPTGPVTIAVVCDGVSRSPRPEEAAATAARLGADTLAAAVQAGADHDTATRTAAQAAADAVAGLGSARGGDAPACTYASVVVADGTVTAGWVGDSRVYWLAPAGSVALTVDDSWANDVVASGELTRAQAESAPLARAITAWLGADAGAVNPHVATHTPGGPGAVLVCTDGVWQYLPEPDALAAVAFNGGPVQPAAAVDALVRHALHAGGHDNATAVLISYPPAREGSS